MCDQDITEYPGFPLSKNFPTRNYVKPTYQGRRSNIRSTKINVAVDYLHEGESESIDLFAKKEYDQISTKDYSPVDCFGCDYRKLCFSFRGVTISQVRNIVFCTNHGTRSTEKH